MRLPVVAFCLMLVASAAHAAPSLCETYWLQYGGKEDPENLSLRGSWPLERFTTMQPWWYYGENDLGLPRQSQKSELQWRPVAMRAELRNLGDIRGRRVYEVTYSPLERVIVWSRGDSSFCPALMVSGDESIVFAIHQARVFRWDDRDLVHVRIQFQGTGHFQESVFLTNVGGTLVHLRTDERTKARIRSFYEAHRIAPYHRGLGFCEGQLVEQRLCEDAGDGTPCIDRRVVIRYSVDHDRLTVNQIGFAHIPEDDKSCQIFPKP